MEYECQVIEIFAQPTLYIRTRTPQQTLPQLIGEGYAAIAAYASGVGQAFAGRPYVAYYNMDMQDLDIEIGIPVAGKIKGEGDVQGGELPGGKAASTIHVGPYDQLRSAYDALSAWMAEQGYEPDQAAYEFYLNDPGEVSPGELETQILFPLK